MGRTPINPTVYIFDVEKLRDSVKSEKGLRGVSYADIERETGVSFGQIATFCSEGRGVGINGLVSLAMWANVDVRSLIKRTRNAARHVATPQEKELRNLAAYLSAAGLKPVEGESPVEAAIRLIAAAKAQGADFEEEADV